MANDSVSISIRYKQTNKKLQEINLFSCFFSFLKSNLIKMRKIILILILLTFVIGCTREERTISEISEPIDTQEETQKQKISGSVVETDGLIDGKTLSERLGILKTNLHTPGSGDEAKKLFPDFVSVYVDHNKNPYFSMVVPFTYYYSEEADITVSICNIKMTVFICEGRIDRLIAESDYNKCQITDAYLHPETYRNN